MAGNYSGDVGSYSHSYFTSGMQERLTNIAGATASLAAWARFRARNKVLVSGVSLVNISAPTLTSGSLNVIFYDTGATATTLKSLTISSCSAGWATALTFTGKTLETLTQYIALTFTANEKGDWDVLYDYQVLYPDTYT